MSTMDSLVPTGATIGPSGTSWCGVVSLEEGKCGQKLSTLLTLLMVYFSVSVVEEVEFLQEHLVYGELLAGLLMRRTKVRNNLCHLLVMSFSLKFLF